MTEEQSSDAVIMTEGPDFIDTFISEDEQKVEDQSDLLIEMPHPELSSAAPYGKPSNYASKG